MVRTAIVGEKNRDTNMFKTGVVINTRRLTLQGFVQENVSPDRDKSTDKNRGYQRLANNSSVIHNIQEFVNGIVHTNGIEFFLSMLKQSHKGTFPKILPKNFGRYVSEFTCELNVRPQNTFDIMFRKMAQRRLTTKKVTANGLDSGTRRSEENAC